METNIADPSLSTTPLIGRKVMPSHYTFKIQSFSLLSKSSIDRCSSEEFEAGGHKWIMSIYPNGYATENGHGHVSIYVAIVGDSSFPIDWEINAIINLFAYNFIEDEYVSIKDTSVRRLHFLRKWWGVPKFIKADTFHDPSNGFLVGDSCVFGAEIFIVKMANRGNCLSIIQPPQTVPSGSWKFDQFSLANLKKYEFDLSLDENFKWKLILYPDGMGEGKGKSISLFLALDVSTLPPIIKLDVECILRAKNQINDQHAERYFKRKFSKSNPVWGSKQLVGLAELKNPSNGFLVDDTCIFEVEILISALISPN